MDIAGQYFMYNNDFAEAKDFYMIENPGDVVLYEVFRVINGVPLFLEEHIERLHTSVELTGKRIAGSTTEIKNSVLQLIEKNKIYDGNIRLNFIYASHKEDNPNCYIFFIPHKYPKESCYQRGVDCGIFHAERLIPNAKVVMHKLRYETEKYLRQYNLFELILVDHEQFVTEGSKSNLFFVKKGKLYTSPHQNVLLGITRKKVLKLARENNIEVIEKKIELKSLSGYESVFLTGTSPKILPIKKIEDLVFDPQNELCQKIISLYNKEIQNYLDNN